MIEHAASVSTLAAVSGDEIGIVAVIGGLSIVVISIVFGSINSMCNRRQQEQTKREIAAYIAEGSISPAEGERLVAASATKGICKG